MALIKEGVEMQDFLSGQKYDLHLKTGPWTGSVNPLLGDIRWRLKILRQKGGKTHVSIITDIL